jgi:hypothetical protein
MEAERGLYWRARLVSLIVGLSCAARALDVYPSPGGDTLASPFFSAAVGPQALPAFVYFTARGLMQPVAPGNNVPQPSDRNTSFFGFAFDPATDGRVTVVVTLTDAGAAPPSTAQIFPLRAAALLPAPTIAGRAITLTLDQPRQVCLVVDGRTDAPLCVFADPPETYVPSPSDPGVIFFGPGTVDAGVITVAEGQTVYLAGGAHVYGRIEMAAGSSGACSAAGASVAVRGRGVLDGHRFTIDVNGPPLISLQCLNALLEGVTLIDSPQYNLAAYWPYTTVRWVKAIAWGFSTDGFTGGSQSVIESSFLKVNDDSLKLFATGTLATDIVLWQMENGCVVMGSWNLNTNQAFITARRIDVIRHERTARWYDPDALFCFMHGGSAALANYLFDDVRVDMPGYAAVQIFVANNSFAHPTGALGSVLNVIVRNFSSTAPFIAPQSVQLQGYAAASNVAGLVLDSVSFGGRAAGQANVAISGNPGFVGPVTFCAGCSQAVVGADWTSAQKCSMPDSYCKSSGAEALRPAPLAAATGAVVAVAAAAAAAAAEATAAEP